MRLLHRERPFTRDIAAVAGGLAMGVVSSRLLPPLLAGAAGSVRASLGANPFDRLVQDHRSVLSMLERLVGASDDSTARRMAIFLAVKRALAKHALAEESGAGSRPPESPTPSCENPRAFMQSRYACWYAGSSLELSSIPRS